MTPALQAMLDGIVKGIADIDKDAAEHAVQQHQEIAKVAADAKK